MKIKQLKKVKKKKMRFSQAGQMPPQREQDINPYLSGALKEYY